MLAWIVDLSGTWRLLSTGVVDREPVGADEADQLVGVPDEGALAGLDQLHLTGKATFVERLSRQAQHHRHRPGHRIVVQAAGTGGVPETYLGSEPGWPALRTGLRSEPGCAPNRAGLRYEPGCAPNRAGLRYEPGWSPARSSASSSVSALEGETPSSAAIARAAESSLNAGPRRPASWSSRAERT